MGADGNSAAVASLGFEATMIFCRLICRGFWARPFFRRFRTRVCHGLFEWVSEGSANGAIFDSPEQRSR